jgi:DNA sulfur modification protein DndD
VHRLVEEWRSILHPPPSGVPDEPWFGSFSLDELQEAARTVAQYRASARDEVSDRVEAYRTLVDRERKLKDRIDTYDSDLESNARIADYEALLKRQGAVEEEIDRLQGDERVIQVRLQEKRREYSLKQGELDNLNRAQESLRVASDIIDTLREFRDELRRSRIGELEHDIETMMQKLAHKGEDLVADVDIDPDTFQLSLRDRSGNEILQPSAGEKEILALSMIWALGRISRRDLPIVIDTPLGRLDKTHRSNVVRHFLPGAASQVIVLATDAEVDEHWESLLAPSLASVQHLDNDPRLGVTVAVPDGADG